MNSLRKLFIVSLISLGGMAVLGVSALGISYMLIAPSLPSIDDLKDIRMQVPMRVYTRDGLLMSEFGETRRTPVRFEETPDLMVKAILAAEDDRFFSHPGVDYQGLLRAAVNLIRTGEKSQGGSTITMQVARNFFLSSEKTYLRKLREIFLSFKIEHQLSKEEILELYLNKIFLGNRAYGVVSAANTYYGVDLDQLHIHQMAMIAGLPKAPSSTNPIAGPERALIRRNYVLRRMHELGYIDGDTYRTELRTPDNARLYGLSIEVAAHHVAEMARNAVVERYGEEIAYTTGLKVYTTLDSRLQQAAVAALRGSLIDYDQRHGYRGAERRLDIAGFEAFEDWQRALDNRPIIGGLVPAIVMEVHDNSAVVVPVNGDEAIEIPWEGLSWARKYIDSHRRGPAPRSAADILDRGDVIRIRSTADGWRLSQLPAVEGALVALAPADGAVMALAGGFDFRTSKFNRATQAMRQPGSSFKPFIYSAALDKGFTPASLVNDAPVVFDDPGLESAWRPGNYTGEFYGPTRLRVALKNSRNLVSIRLLRSIGIGYGIDYMTRFGFDHNAMPRDLSLSLGSGIVSPMQLTSGYAVFANGGYRIEPYFIDRIIGHNDEVLFQASPAIVCPDCKTDDATVVETSFQPIPVTDSHPGHVPEQVIKQPQRVAEQVISPQNAYLITSMLRDVIQSGTGVRARQLGRNDLAGKTGTTNDLRDAWFAGYNADIVATAWIGFDQSRTLGNSETGSRAALPMWIDFMKEALQGVPEKPLTRPPALITVRIDPETGLLAPSGQASGIFETFQVEHVPRQHAVAQPGMDGEPARGGRRQAPEQLF